jgi:hypothetical protein
MLVIGATGEGTTVMAHSEDVLNKWACGGVRDGLEVATNPAMAEADSLPMLTTYALRNWLRVNADIPAGTGYGAWKSPDNGHIYFDVVDFYDDKESALEVARARGELAVFDIATGETAWVN